LGSHIPICTSAKGQAIDLEKDRFRVVIIMKVRFLADMSREKSKGRSLAVVHYEESIATEQTIWVRQYIQGAIR
jgi:hypothetical protein